MMGTPVHVTVPCRHGLYQALCSHDCVEPIPDGISNPGNSVHTNCAMTQESVLSHHANAVREPLITKEIDR